MTGLKNKANISVYVLRLVFLYNFFYLVILNSK